MKRINKNLELIKLHIQKRKDLRVILDSGDFGTFKFDKDNNRYIGEFGYLDIEEVVNAYKHQLRGDNYFIELALPDEWYLWL